MLIFVISSDFVFTLYFEIKTNKTLETTKTIVIVAVLYARLRDLILFIFTFNERTILTLKENIVISLNG